MINTLHNISFKGIVVANGTAKELRSINELYEKEYFADDYFSNGSFELRRYPKTFLWMIAIRWLRMALTEILTIIIFTITVSARFFPLLPLLDTRTIRTALASCLKFTTNSILHKYWNY